jgi:hypothetical protein
MHFVSSGDSADKMSGMEMQLSNALDNSLLVIHTKSITVYTEDELYISSIESFSL